ncbi:sigma factor-like helix-turn-helix DNA-binding protein [Streptomyces cucumeris]|uniref:sigma factor-like helix-turn-helix DNA-binding protein n=1 Tax=Streptomyces cucumeris TaxID=2962890 RepID=UPI003D705D15
MRFFCEQTQSQIGDHPGISQMHVSRLINRTCKQLGEQAGVAPAAHIRAAGPTKISTTPRGRRGMCPGGSRGPRLRGSAGQAVGGPFSGVHRQAPAGHHDHPFRDVYRQPLVISEPGPKPHAPGHAVAAAAAPQMHKRPLRRIGKRLAAATSRFRVKA